MKKIIPVVALASALGIAGLASCSPKEVIKEVIKEVEVEVPVEVEKPVHHHHYGISVEAKEGVTVTVEKTGEVGKTVTVKASVAEGSEFTISGLEAGEGVEVKASETAGEWTFTMPERPVTIKVNTSDVLYDVTVTNPDETKGTMSVVDAETGEAVTSAPAGKALIAKYTQTDTTKREATVKVGETEVALDGSVAGYPFTMPSGGATITYTLIDAVYRVTVSSPLVGTDFESGKPFVLSLISNTENYDDEQYHEFVDGSVAIDPTRLVDGQIETVEGATSRITGIEVNGKAIEFMPAPYPGTPLTFSFVMPAADATIKVITEEIPTVKVQYITDAYTEAFVSEWDETIGDNIKKPAPTTALVGGTFNAFAEVTDPSRVIDPETSGVYLADGTKVDGGLDITGSMVTIYGPETIEGDFQVRLFSTPAYDANGLSGSWAARETFGALLGETTLDIQSDGSFTFVYDDAKFSTAKTLAGKLIATDEGSYHWDNAPAEEVAEGEPTTPEEEPKISTFDIWPALAEDGSISWLNARYYDAEANNTAEMYLSQGLRVNVYQSKGYYDRDDDTTKLRYIETSATEGAWTISTPEEMAKTTLTTKSSEGATVEVTPKEFNYKDIYETKVGFNRKYLKYDGGDEIIWAGAERGLYKVKDLEGQAIIGTTFNLDGFGSYTSGEETGTYTYDAFTKVLKVKPSAGDARAYTDISGRYIKELQVREVGVKDAVSGLTYEIDANTSGMKKKLVFVDRDSVKLPFVDSVSYKYDDTTKEIHVRWVDGKEQGDIIMTLNDDLSVTVKEGSYWMCDSLAGKTYKTTTLNITLTDSAKKGEDLVLTGGETPTYTLGNETGSYTITYSETGALLTAGTKNFEFDFTSKTYTKKIADVSWVNAANASFKVGEHTYYEDWYSETSYSQEGNEVTLSNGSRGWIDVQITFNADGSLISKLSISNAELKNSPYGGAPTMENKRNNSWTDCEFVLDAESATLTVKLNDAEAVDETIVFDIDSTGKTLVCRDSNIVRTNTKQSVELTKGLVVKLVA